MIIYPSLLRDYPRVWDPATSCQPQTTVRIGQFCLLQVVVTALSSAGPRPGSNGLAAPAGTNLAGEVDLATVAKRKRKQHHWSAFNRAQPSSHLMATSNDSVQQG